MRIFANRGANGIDGVTSTAVGVALSGAPTVLLTGDVAFLHDSNGLHRGRTDGTCRWSWWSSTTTAAASSTSCPSATNCRPPSSRRCSAHPTGSTSRATAEALGLPVDRVNTRAGLQAAIAGALTRGGTRVVVVRTDREANVGVHAAIADAVVAAVDGRAHAGALDFRPDGDGGSEVACD